MTNHANGRFRKRHGSRHHIISRSIGGPDVPENKYNWTKEKHTAYHQLFCNYLPSIAIGIIRLWTEKDGKLKIDLMRPKNVKAWQEAFNGGTPEQVIQFIQKNFLPVEKKFLHGKLKNNNEKKQQKVLSLSV